MCMHLIRMKCNLCFEGRLGAGTVGGLCVYFFFLSFCTMVKGEMSSCFIEKETEDQRG